MFLEFMEKSEAHRFMSAVKKCEDESQMETNWVFHSWRKSLRLLSDWTGFAYPLPSPYRELQRCQRQV
jgi:hypothetical protein